MALTGGYGLRFPCIRYSRISPFGLHVGVSDARGLPLQSSEILGLRSRNSADCNRPTRPPLVRALSLRSLPQSGTRCVRVVSLLCARSVPVVCVLCPSCVRVVSQLCALAACPSHHGSAFRLCALLLAGAGRFSLSLGRVATGRSHPPSLQKGVWSCYAPPSVFVGWRMEMACCVRCTRCGACWPFGRYLRCRSSTIVFWLSPSALPCGLYDWRRPKCSLPAWPLLWGLRAGCARSCAAPTGWGPRPPALFARGAPGPFSLYPAPFGRAPRRGSGLRESGCRGAVPPSPFLSAGAWKNPLLGCPRSFVAWVAQQRIFQRSREQRRVSKCFKETRACDFLFVGHAFPKKHFKTRQPDTINTYDFLVGSRPQPTHHPSLLVKLS